MGGEIGKMMMITAADGHELSAYVARADGVAGSKAAGSKTAKGAVVVLQEIFGVNGQIRAVADELAKEGYVAIAPALFDRYERGVELTDQGDDMKKAFRELYPQLKPESALLDVAAAFAEVAREDQRVAVMGFCFGGLMSWLSATRGAGLGMRPACCVGYYPGGIGKVAGEELVCPVMLHFGGADSHLGPDQVAAVKTAHPGVEIFVYEGAEHAFAGTQRTAYQPEQAKLAWGRTLGFLDRYVGNNLR